MAKIQLTQTGAKIQNDLDLVENIFAQFSTTSTYDVGNVVAYQGHLWKCITAVTTAGAWTGATNWEQTTVETLLGGKINTGGLKTLNSASLEGSGDISIPVVAINPTLDGTEGEILGLAVNGTKYMTPSLSKTDGVSFAFGSDSNFTFGDSYSSYNRCGNELTFVVACSITKDNATTDPITLGTFSNIPSALFAKLIPTTVGGNDYLENCDIKAFSGAYAFVNASIAMVKGSNQDVSLTIETTNMVVGTKYHVRYMVSFLLTDNLSSIDAVLDNNSWADIASVCEAGNAGNYWSVGDIKNDNGTDGYTRGYQIMDMTGLYGKHVVFQQVKLDGTDGSGSNGVQWNSSSNTDSDSCYNNYNISTMRSTFLPSLLLKLSSDLQAVITNTTYQVATNGNNGVLLSLTDKLFLPAAKEIGQTSYSRSEENSALTTFAYWSSHSSNADHIKYIADGTTAKIWWTRSPRSGITSYVCYVNTYGSANNNVANNSYWVSSCFTL